MTKEEWIEYFELVNDRWPSRLEINHAREVGEIKGEARDVPVDSRLQREREVRTNLDYQQVPFSNRGSGLSQS